MYVVKFIHPEHEELFVEADSFGLRPDATYGFHKDGNMVANVPVHNALFVDSFDPEIETAEPPVHDERCDICGDVIEELAEIENVEGGLRQKLSLSGRAHVSLSSHRDNPDAYVTDDNGIVLKIGRKSDLESLEEFAEALNEWAGK